MVPLFLGCGPSGLCCKAGSAPSQYFINGQRPITADTALRLGLYFAMEARFWLNLQSEYDTRVAMRELHIKIAPHMRVLTGALDA